MIPDSKKIRFNFKGDKITLIIVIFLTGISVIAVYSSIGKEVVTHLLHICVCYLGLFAAYHIDYRKLSRFSSPAFLLALALLVITLVSGAMRGVRIGGTTIQTLYLVGFLYIFFITKYLAIRINRNEPLTLKESLFLCGTLLVFCALISLINMSTAIILFMTGLVIFFIGNVKMRYLFESCGVALVALIVVVSVVQISGKDVGRVNTVINRVTHFVQSDNADNYEDQMVLSKAAIARSGLHPAGPGNGIIKYRLPEGETDYVFASLCEEIGTIIGILVIFSYLVLIYRARVISREASGAFGSLLAFGIAFWFTFQAFVHIGVNCGLLPATGQTLPFISRGGASLFISGWSIGVLLNISKVNVLEKDKEDPMRYFH